MERLSIHPVQFHCPSLCSQGAQDHITHPYGLHHTKRTLSPPSKATSASHHLQQFSQRHFCLWGPPPVGAEGLFSYLTLLLCSWPQQQAAHTVNPGDEVLSSLMLGLLNHASPACCDRFLTIITLHKAQSLLLNSVCQSHQNFPLPLHLWYS